MKICFTGHRKLCAENISELCDALASLIHELSSAPDVTFLAGGAVGFDMLAALSVLSEREISPHIRLELMLPCKEQAHRWSDSDIEKYKYIIENADSVTYVSEHYDRSCMHRRNRAMVDNSDICVAYLTSDKGGTAYTVKYAESRGKRVINLADSI